MDPGRPVRRERGDRKAGGPGWGGGGEVQVCNRNSSGWRAQICSCGRLPAVSFVPSDAPEARAPAPAPCLPPKGGSRLSAGAMCPEGLGQKVARISHKSRYCRRCSPHSWALSTGCFLCAWLFGALFVSWDQRKDDVWALKTLYYSVQNQRAADQKLGLLRECSQPVEGTESFIHQKCTNVYRVLCQILWVITTCVRRLPLLACHTLVYNCYIFISPKQHLLATEFSLPLGSPLREGPPLPSLCNQRTSPPSTSFFPHLHTFIQGQVCDQDKSSRILLWGYYIKKDR